MVIYLNDILISKIARRQSENQAGMAARLP